MRSQLFLVFILLIVIAAVGCDARIERFESNDVYAISLAKSRRTPTEAAAEDARPVVETLFGTPDEPRWPAEWLSSAEAKSLVSEERLRQAAGPVASDQDGSHTGLFREHCVACHGLAGSGAGPTSRFQNPYPRDFRHGIFKWKETERAAKPTRDDLVAVLRRGIAGTAMPSFQLMAPEELEAIVDYLLYLSVRGEVERELMAVAVDELGYDETVPEADLRLGSQEGSEGEAVVGEVLNDVVQSWIDAEGRVAPVPDLPELSFERNAADDEAAFDASVARGREIFHGQVANCAGCHGPEGNGGVAILDYDDWTKEYSTRIGLTPNDREAMRPLREAGALPPRPIEPRHLQRSVLRGGNDPETLFRRITQGIAGTPMPGVEWVQEPNSKGLTEDQIWDLVRYVLWLGHSET